MGSSAQDKTRVQSVERALRLLRAFDQHSTELGVSELSRRLCLPKSIVFRLLATLEDAGFIEQNPVTRNYCLGPTVFELAGVYAGHNGLIKIGEPFLRDLVAHTGLTAQLGIRDGYECISLLVVDSPMRVRVALRPGERTLAYATATGKVLLAALRNDEVQLILPRPLAALTHNTITDPAAVLVELDRVRQRGYAMNHAEYSEGDVAVAAPVRDFHNQVVAGLSLSWPTHMISESQIPDLIRRVMQSADAMSRRLGAPAAIVSTDSS